MFSGASESSIGAWSPQQLEAFLRSKLQQDPTMLPHGMQSRELRVTEALYVAGARVFPKQPAWISGTLQSGPQSIPSGVSTPVVLDVLYPPTAGPPSNGTTDPSYSAGTFTFNSPGWYLATGNLEYIANAVNQRRISFTSTGVLGALGYDGQVNVPAAAAGNTHVSSSIVDYFGIGTTIQLSAQQNSGGALNVIVNGAFITIIKLSDR